MKHLFQSWWQKQPGSKMESAHLSSALQEVALQAWMACADAEEAKRSRDDGDHTLQLLDKLLSSQASKHDLLICYDHEDGFWLKLVDRGGWFHSGIAMDRKPGRLRLTLAEAIREAIRFDNEEWIRIFQRPKYPQNLVGEEILGNCPRCSTPLKEVVRTCKTCNDDHYYLVCDKCSYSRPLVSSHLRCQRTT